MSDATAAPDNDQRTSAQGLFNYADSYLIAARSLWTVQLNVTFPEAPVRFLLYHAAELHLKAFLRCAGASVSELHAKGHKFSKLLPAARSYGLSIDRGCQAVLLFGERTGDIIESRYIRTGYRRWYSTETLAQSAAEVRRAVRCHPLRAKLILRGERTGFIDDECERAWVAP